jgi:titin
VQIAAQAQSNTIGGTDATSRNVISGNLNQGVLLNGGGTTGNRVQGNYIGTDAAGTAAVANSFGGVDVVGGANNNIIGGTAPGAGNVISGNNTRGVTLAQSGTTANEIAGNFIGLNASGNAALPNAGPGISIFNGAHHNTIGDTAGGRNFIAGNNGAGLTLSGDGTAGNIVRGNSIGVSPSGVAVANSAEGIALFADFTGGAAGNLIGGSIPGAANLISGNAGAGVAIYNDFTVNNRISGNSIFGNGGLGIDIWGDGVTTNDGGDADTGPNNLQNFPVLTSAVLGLATTVSGSLSSAANTTFRIEFFASATGDASGNGEGQNFIGAISVTTNGSGDATFAPALPALVLAGQKITATATDPAGNTSEFAGNVTVTTTDTDGDGLPNVYETANGLLTNSSDASLDFDGDGMSNLAEFRAGTDPRNASSVLRLAPPGIIGGDVALSLGGMIGRTYRVEFADSLDSPVQWRLLADQIPSAATPIPLLDPGAAVLSRRFYRATVQP